MDEPLAYLSRNLIYVKIESFPLPPFLNAWTIRLHREAKTNS